MVRSNTAGTEPSRLQLNGSEVQAGLIADYSLLPSRNARSFADLGAASRLKDAVLRAFILAQALEPLADKPDCTTRYVDSSPGTKLEYFIISAVNSAFPILNLVDAILDAGGLPSGIFEYAHQAQLNSPRNRLGGKCNYAQILMLTPIIIAQSLLCIEGRLDGNVDRLVRRAQSAMRQTTPSDVAALQKLVDLSRELSEAHHVRIGTPRVQLQPQFDERFSTIAEATQAEGFSHTMMATEIWGGYPVCQWVYDELSKRGEGGLIPQSVQVYNVLRAKVGRHDIAADCIVVGFYLSLYATPSAIFFP